MEIGNKFYINFIYEMV